MRPLPPHSIELPDGRELHTLRDAAEYITELPAEEHDRDRWWTAIEVLLLSAEHGEAGADPVLARIAMTRALNAVSEMSTAPAPRRKRAKRYKVVR
jgi:hypothetical protein